MLMTLYGVVKARKGTRVMRLLKHWLTLRLESPMGCVVVETLRRSMIITSFFSRERERDALERIFVRSHCTERERDVARA
jgi:hypothetical protein